MLKQALVGLSALVGAYFVSTQSAHGQQAEAMMYSKPAYQLLSTPTVIPFAIHKPKLNTSSNNLESLVYNGKILRVGQQIEQQNKEYKELTEKESPEFKEAMTHFRNPKSDAYAVRWGFDSKRFVQTLEVDIEGITFFSIRTTHIPTFNIFLKSDNSDRAYDTIVIYPIIQFGEKGFTVTDYPARTLAFSDGRIFEFVDTGIPPKDGIDKILKYSDPKAVKDVMNKANEQFLSFKNTTKEINLGPEFKPHPASHTHHKHPDESL